MRRTMTAVLAAACSCAALAQPGPGGAADAPAAEREWTSRFLVSAEELSSTGRNPYFILEPGHRLTLERGDERVVITVLDETRTVDGVETRVVEERETEEGVLTEVSRNYFAISTRTNCVYYFGEEVDIYENGVIIRHSGEWLAGSDGARFGLIMPGQPLLGARYYQEFAPDAAMDRAEVVALDATLDTPAGRFARCLRTLETSPLEPGAREYKLYAPGVGLVQDEDLLLVDARLPIEGGLETVAPAPLDPAYDAALQAATGLGLTIAEQVKDGLGATIRASRAGGGDVTVTLARLAPGLTTIRVVAGSERAAEAVLREFRARLRTLPEAPED